MTITDWIEGVIFLPHDEIKTGMFANVDIGDDGQYKLVSYKPKRLVCEGSYESSFTIQTCPYDYLDFYSQFDDQIASLPVDKRNHVFLHFSGNPVKFLQGHNVFGVSDIFYLVHQTLKRCFQVAGFDSFIPSLRSIIYNGDWRVTKIDLTKMIQLLTSEQVRDYLEHARETSHVRNGRVEFSDNTLYFGSKKRTGWAFKMYDKYLELSSRSKKHQLPDALKSTGIKEFCEGQVRCELRIFKKELDRHGLTDPFLLAEKIEELFIMYLNRIDMTPQKENDENLYCLPRRLVSTYLLWKQGKNMRDVLPRTTYYNHRSGLLAFNIDISKKPLSSKVKRLQTKTVKEILQPQQVNLSDIPSHLTQYLASPDNHLRVA